MPINYSKWDKLELSDDSDIEVHPNVDKRSFIRAKQSQIHLERQQRRHQIETLKYERQVNDGLARRIGRLLTALRAHEAEARQSPTAAAEVAFRAVMESQGGDDDRPPAPPAGVHGNVEQPASYSQMMAALLDQVNKALEDKDKGKKGKGGDGGEAGTGAAARFDGMVAEIESHRQKVEELQGQLVQKLAELEREEASKITSDSIHTGFDSSHVNKAKPGEASGGGGGKAELLNPGYKSAQGAGAAAGAGAGAGTGTGSGPGPRAPAAGSAHDDAAAAAADDDDPTEPTALARAFAAIAPANHYDSRAFIVAHPEILADERHEEGILILAFDAEMEGAADTARRCVHQAKLIEYCRSLGRDGVALFFKRIETRDHKAHELFYGDVQDTYVKIRTRVKEIKAQQAASASADGIEQIQLHAVEPGTVINIRIPPPVAAADADAGDADAVAEARRARAIFEGFAPEMRAALESGSLDKVNEVLGRMRVDEAEALVSEFSEAGILSMEEEIIDATTEEGRAHLKEMGREDFVDDKGVATGSAAPAGETKEEYGDPE